MMNIELDITQLILKRYDDFLADIEAYKIYNNKLYLICSLHNLRGLEERFYKEDKDSCARVFNSLFADTDDCLWEFLNNNNKYFYKKMCDITHLNKDNVYLQKITFDCNISKKKLLWFGSYCCMISLIQTHCKKPGKKMREVLNAHGLKEKYGTRKKLETKLGSLGLVS